jgi:Antitoxin Xre-like helix-turn-helix domain
MLMLDRAHAAVGIPGAGVLPCRYCTPGRETPPAPDGPDPAWLAHLYLCSGLSTYAIGELTGLDRQRVARMLRKAQVPLRPRGAGRQRPPRRDDPPGLQQLLAGLYQAGRLGSPQVAAITGIPERTVRDRLRRYGIAVRTRGGWNREDRRTVPAEDLDELYTRLGLTADEVGRRLGITRSTVLRSAHALGVPVRAGGAVPVSGPEEIELVAALYADPLISAALDARDVPRVPPGAPLWARFPEPVPLTAPLVKDLYWGCGAGLAHIELLTGQPAMTVRGFMRRAGIPLRHPGGRTPFLRRWRASRQAGLPAGGLPLSRAGRPGRPQVRQE